MVVVVASTTGAVAILDAATAIIARVKIVAVILAYLLFFLLILCFILVPRTKRKNKRIRSQKYYIAIPFLQHFARSEIKPPPLSVLADVIPSIRNTPYIQLEQESLCHYVNSKSYEHKGQNHSPRTPHSLL